MDARIASMALVLLGACGGTEPPREEAPLPEAWVRADEGPARPRSTTIGDPAASSTSTGGPAPETIRDERALRAELAQELADSWAREPGHPRAMGICTARRRIAALARRWIDAYGRAHPGVTQDPAEVHETLGEIDRWCTARETRDNPELVEGAFQSLAAEVDERAAAADAL
jgi:hypothetical protein